MSKPYQICTRCIMDTTDPDIVFDAGGVCNHCTGWFKRAQFYSLPLAERTRQLNALVEEMKAQGRGHDYDCIIGVSGGVDSSYLAIKVKELGLRPLAIHVDNGWNSEKAVGNIKRLLDALQIDLSTVVLNWKEFRELQLAFLRASTPDSEIPSDHAIVASFYNASARHHIGYCISGINFRTEGIHVREWSQGHLDGRYIKSVYRRFTGKRLKYFPVIPVVRLVLNIVLHRPRTIFMLDYLEYDKAEAKRLLMDKYGWEDYGGKHYESLYTKFYQGWMLPHKFGYDKRRMHLSTLVCSGQMSRAQALDEIALPAYPPDQIEPDTEFVAKKLGVSRQEFDAIMASPRRRYMDYPNLQNHWIFGRGLDLYRFLRHKLRWIR
ncbi:MAG: N-acetyl sugar amidotransferase [Proteobacteria bacterium]|nr:N-acetyl sugar amidotransferase [Pseudomonadota bacterium]